MKRTSINGSYAAGLLKCIREHLKFFLLLLAIVLSMAAGALIVKHADDTMLSSFSELIMGHIRSRSGQSMVKTMLLSLSSNVLVLGVIFVLGMNMIGTPFIPFALIFKGLGAGAQLGYLYRFEGISGVLYSLLIVLLPTLVSMFAMLMAANDGMSFSSLLLRQSLPSAKPNALWLPFSKYLKRFLVFLILIVFAALCDGVLSLGFMRYFQF